MARYIDLTGQQFHYWTVLHYSHKNERSAVYWWCRCKCGVEKAVSATSLRGYGGNSSKSCGCYKVEKLKNDKKGRNHKHGYNGHPIYKKWKQMRYRCNNPESDRYKNYGGRGIKVCERWDDFQSFYDDMAPTWWEGASLDRIDVDGDYTPNNCRWIEPEEQAKNKTTTLYVTFEGEKRRLIDVCEADLVPNSYGTIKSRLKMGWSEEDALWKDVEDNMSSGEKAIKEWLIEQGIKYEYNKTFDDCRNKQYLVFDFFLPQHDVLIEYDGVHHFEPCLFGDRKETAEEMLEMTQEHDKIKDEYAEESGYKMIRIADTSKGNTVADIEAVRKILGEAIR